MEPLLEFLRGERFFKEAFHVEMDAPADNGAGTWGSVFFDTAIFEADGPSEPGAPYLDFFERGSRG